MRSAKKCLTTILTALALANGAMAADAPKPGGTLVIGSTQVPRHLNGAVQSGTATALPSAQLFASLLRYDDDWKPQPYLAQSWELAPDGKSLTLHLRQDAVFHDGKPVTSADVAFSVMAVKKNHPFQTMLAPVEAVDTPDPYTVVLRMSKPHPAILLALSPALMPVLPKHIYDDGQDLKNHPRNSADVVGSGPFKFKEFKPGQEIVLEKFDKFFLPGKPYLDRIVVKINPDATNLLIGLERGDIAALPFMTEPTILRRAKDNPAIAMTSKGYEGIGALSWLAFNTARKPLNDVRVRQAIAYATDKGFITKALNAGFAKPADGPIIGTSPFATPDVVKYPLDLKKSEQLLEEAGFKKDGKGERLSLTVDYMPGSDVQGKNVAEYLRSQLKKVGIAVQVRASPDFPTWAKRIASKDFDMTTDIVFNWGDPVIGVHRTYLSSNIRDIIWTNTQSYSNPKVDELLEQAGTETDVDKRRALYAEFQRLVTTDVPIDFLTVIPYHTLSSKKVHGLPDGIWGVMSPMDDTYLQ
ncbi:ABC transporter substrate-binding protein [Achromobacter insolitus]|uniref:ABC transporter substrate-binding protein n=1 Tax=Achromobacter TaxID=222 RepID=UPI00053691EF|nr:MULTISPECIES: ABC transporter substrate-binding protein [Achromobacter]AVG39075.1 peptide ABC transporter substrate-binding protein [Achromobacter insolitus]AXA69758.1 peptide ABC transporter substrate-binding protein [Achromobacter insolitus]MCP1403637.1 peptide/nickel transport system substrate-binding protein [Achromobacter insolitus]MDH3064946.1 ABC transporter substrate-binding protein [Achromobacter insolitus]MEB3096715.1 ABC transporter substrate-binding protein [Achromobacter sp. D1